MSVLYDNTINGTESADTLLGGDRRDLILGHDGNDLLRGFGNDDRLVGGSGDNTIFGGSGDDCLIGDGSGDDNDSLNGGRGNDFLISGNGRDTLFGGSGRDRLVIGAADAESGEQARYQSYAGGGAGDDEIYAGSIWGAYRSLATLSGGKGNDRLEAFDSDSVMRGGTGRDTLVVSNYYRNDGFNHTMTGGAGADIFVFNNFRYGLNGVDVITDFNAAKDLVLLHASGSLYTEARYYTFEDITVMAKGADTRISLADGRSILLQGVDAGEMSRLQFAALKINGTRKSDTVIGDDRDDVLAGLAGNDVLRSGKGADTLFGGDGDDILRGGKGKDVIYGGAGGDHLYGGRGDDELFASVFEHSDSPDTAVNYLYGGAGNDILRGFNGAAGNGLFGGKGEDTLYGSSGNDTISGGAGFDLMNGYCGADVFLFDDTTAWLERVTAFEFGIDVIRFTGTDAESFAELEIFKADIPNVSGVIVNYGNGSVLLLGENLVDINDVVNFEFV
ncbi:MAG: hypothetical protein KUG74_01765 [Rhodobacteraceae bacterium]|nr:hypothetical protein [Paracoccaceae bacterium]